MEWIVVMDRVGGYANYLLLQEDARAYEQIIIALRGEADADRVRAMKREIGME